MSIAFAVCYLWRFYTYARGWNALPMLRRKPVSLPHAPENPIVEESAPVLSEAGLEGGEYHENQQLSAAENFDIRLLPHLPEFSPELPFFSIIIPARNEAGHIGTCLRSPTRQHYPYAHFEVIVIDDHSKDTTVQLAEAYAQKAPYSLKVLRLQEHVDGKLNSYKKAAIELGIRHAQYPWIITTDADCRQSPAWLHTIAEAIGQWNPVLISAPVKYRYSRSLWDRCLALEHLGLVGIGGASIGLGEPSMANGANLIYQKRAFEEAGGFAGIDHIASGDDELLVHKLHKRSPGGIRFLKSPEAIVWADPSPSLDAFLHQRKRWVSKSKHYRNPKMKLTMTGVWLYHALMLALFIAGFFNISLMLAASMFFGIKILSEFLFLRRVAKDLDERHLLPYYFVALPFQILYLIFIGVYGNFGRYHWKGRKVR